MSLMGVDGRFLLAAAVLHALVLWAGNFGGQRAQYGMAASSGSASVAPPSTARAPQDSDDLTLDFSDQAWASRAAVPRRRPSPPPQAAQPIGTGETKESPGYLLNPHPPYPEEARQLRQSGTVLLRVKVDDAGVVKSVELAKSSGYPLLDESALQTVKGWKFQPARLAGVAVSSTVDVPIVFSLTD